MSSPQPQLVLDSVCKEYPTPAGPLRILENVSLSLSSGESLAITGPSGSGKSTLLYLIGTLEPPTSGSIFLGGINLFQLSPHQQAQLRNRFIGFIFQDHHLLPHCSVIENILIPSLPSGNVTPELESRALALLTRVGLEGRQHHRPAQLSGGERQRTAVCRALINKPAVLLADEPTGNLDWNSAQNVGSLLTDVAREEHAILICVTHSRELAARFPKHLQLKNGQLFPPN